MRLSYSLVALALLTACSSDIMAPPSPSEIQNAPSQIVVAGVELTLETYLFRDFAPISESNGKPLIASVRVKPAAGKALPADLRAEALHVVNGDEVWTPRLIQESPNDRPPQMEFVARDGPKWGPGVTVDVVLRLRSGDRALLLKAPSQPIHRTD
jgi:hypothetical protein